MNLQIARWGNSLAVRLPAEMIRAAGWAEGDQIEAAISVDGGITLKPKAWDRATFVKEMRQARLAMKPGTSVIDELRRGGSY
jgi:antitoxin MazE